MHVRKFEADSLDQALQDIKHELGPDAIILKTITNKGLKGAFKKKKIEITAAISEKNYTKKAHVDHTLNDSQKEQFYSNDSSYISNMIDDYSDKKDGNTPQSAAAGGYGKMALNKQVSSVTTKAKEVGSLVKNSLDDFLSSNVAKEEVVKDEIESALDRYEPVQTHTPVHTESEIQREAPISYNVNDEEVELQKRKIDDLEKRLFELTKSVEKFERKEAQGVYQLRTTLKSLDINEQYIREIVKKAIFELTEEEQENIDSVFEFALREMLEEINVDMPLFSSSEVSTEPVVTVFVSDSSSGQTSTVQKIAALKKDSLIVRSVAAHEEKKPSFTDKMFGIDVQTAESLAEIVSLVRKGIEENRSVFVDLKNISTEVNEIKKFTDGMMRAFKNVEVLVCLSAIHSEVYNKKVISRYGSIANGIVVSNLDNCLNFGSLFNISYEVKELPYKFFGTGEIVPDDIESATAERVLAGIFQLN